MYVYENASTTLVIVRLVACLSVSLQASRWYLLFLLILFDFRFQQQVMYATQTTRMGRLNPRNSNCYRRGIIYPLTRSSNKIIIAFYSMQCAPYLAPTITDVTVDTSCRDRWNSPPLRVSNPLHLFPFEQRQSVLATDLARLLESSAFQQRETTLSS